MCVVSLVSTHPPPPPLFYRNRKHDDKAASCTREDRAVPRIPVRLLHSWDCDVDVHVVEEVS